MTTFYYEHKGHRFENCIAMADFMATDFRENGEDVKAKVAEDFIEAFYQGNSVDPIRFQELVLKVSGYMEK